MAKTSEKIARRYARALFDLCSPAELEINREAIGDLARIWRQNVELREAVLNPAIPAAQRAAVLADIAERVAPGNKHIAGTLQLLLAKNRLVSLPDVATVFSRMVDEVKKLLALEVSSAFALSDTEKNAILSQVQKDFGGLASISWLTDKNLIGGMRVKAGDRMLDGSVRGSLDRVKNVLLNA